MDTAPLMHIHIWNIGLDQHVNEGRPIVWRLHSSIVMIGMDVNRALYMLLVVYYIVVSRCWIAFI